MNTTWVLVALGLPIAVGLLVAWPLWTRRVGDEMGAVAGAGVILMFVVAFIAREYGEVEAVTRRCIDAQVGCHFHPQPFVRYAIYGAIGMCQVFVVFLAGLSTEEHLRKRDEATAAKIYQERPGTADTTPSTSGDVPRGTKSRRS